MKLTSLEIQKKVQEHLYGSQVSVGKPELEDENYSSGWDLISAFASQADQTIRIGYLDNNSGICSMSGDSHQVERLLVGGRWGCEAETMSRNCANWLCGWFIGVPEKVFTSTEFLGICKNINQTPPCEAESKDKGLHRSRSCRPQHARPNKETDIYYNL